MPTNSEIQKTLAEQKEKMDAWLKSQITPVNGQLRALKEQGNALAEQLGQALLDQGINGLPSELKNLIELAEKQSELNVSEELIEESKKIVAQTESAAIQQTVIHQLKEHFQIENTFIEKMLKLKTILSPYYEADSLQKLPIAQRENVTAYLQNLDGLLDHYQTLRFHGPVEDENNPPEEVLKQIGEFFKAEPFRQYAEKIKALGLSQKTIDEIQSTNETFRNTTDASASQAGEPLEPLGAFTIRPVQHLPRHDLHWGGVVDKLTKLNRIDSENLSVFSPQSQSNAEGILARAKATAKDFNLEKGVQESIATAKAQLNEAPRDPEERQAFMLRKILEVNLNTPLENNTLGGEYFAPYLKTALTGLYPEMFYLDHDDKLAVKTDQTEVSVAKYETIRHALGLDLENSHALGAASKTTGLQLDPAQFNAAALDKLYQGNAEHQGDKNLLWLVLKSAMPISDTFTAEQKIDTYRALAHASAFKKQLGGTNKYITAHNLQKAAFEVAKTTGDLPAYKRAFGPESELAKYVYRKIKEHQSQLKSVSSRHLFNAAKARMSQMKQQTQVPEQDEIASNTINFDAFREQFKARFSKTNSTGIQSMIKFMDHQAKNGTLTEGAKFRATETYMRKIAEKRADRAWLQNKKFKLFGSGRNEVEQSLYDEMKKDGFSLQSEETKQFLLDKEPLSEQPSAQSSDSEPATVRPR